MRTVCAILLCLFSLVCSAQEVKMDIQLNGGSVGESRYTRAASGFHSVTEISVGSVKIVSDAAGEFANERLIASKATTNNVGNKSEVTFKAGQVVVLANGKEQGKAPFEDKTGFLAGNLHPQLFQATLKEASRQIRANPATKTVTISAFFVDLGVVVPLKITSLQPKKIAIAGGEQVVERFKVEIGATVIEMSQSSGGEIVGFEVAAQKLRMIVPGWEKLFEDPMAKFPELSQSTFRVRKERGIKVRMRDGVDLVCDVVRPDAEGKFPAILVRTPYGRATETVNGDFYASRGYVFVTQDCRGREESGGKWDPFMSEGPDGFDTIGWVAKQAWCDGKVGMIGGSYAGYVQWAAAVLQPPALKCIIPQVSPPDGMRNIPFDHGVFALYPSLWWAKIVAGRTADFSSLKGGLANPAALTTLPLSKVDDKVLGQNLPFFDRWLTRSTLRDWKGYDYTYSITKVKVPALHISGIWDGDEIGTRINWNALRDAGRTDQWLIFGPWVHAFNTTRNFGDVDYGPGAIIDLESVYVRWFDTWLKGKQVGLEKTPRVRLFVTGANRWVNLSNLPPSPATARTAYLAKGALKMKPGKAEQQGYTYNPAKDKVDKEYLEASQETASTKLTERSMPKSSTLIFRSEPFKRNTAISAPYEVTVRFKSSAKDTDFFAFVADQAPNGEMRLLGQPGKIRTSYLGGMDRQVPLVPGRAYTAKIIPWDFAHEFKKGHRMALVVTSSMFPAFARNLGTTDPIATAVRMVVQKNTILMGGKEGSSFKYHVLWEK